MAAATDWLAAATGLRVLEKRGNAFDAAVATGLVLRIVEPHLNGPGIIAGTDARQNEAYAVGR